MPPPNAAAIEACVLSTLVRPDDGTVIVALLMSVPVPLWLIREDATKSFAA